VLFAHALSAALAGAGFAVAIGVARGEARRPVAAAVAVGALLGGAVLVDYQSAIALVIVAGYLAARRRRALPWIAAGGAPAALLLGCYHWACFGAPWRTGYSFAPDPAHQQGVLGAIGPNREALAQVLITPDNGLVVLMPWVVLAAVGAVVLWRRRTWRAEAVTCALIAVSYVVFVGSLVPEFGRAGSSVGPRYIAVAMPFFAWLAAAALDAIDPTTAAGPRATGGVLAALVDDKALLRGLAHRLILAAVAIMVVATTTLPYWPPEVANPVYEVGFWALGRGHVSPSLGPLVGLHGVASIVPLYAVVAALIVVLIGRGQRGRLISLAAAAVIATAWIAVLGQAPRTVELATRRDYLERLWTGAAF
jgi:hypothetical protein